MAKFAEIVRFRDKLNGSVDESCMNAFARALNWDIVVARKTVGEYGTGMLYTRGSIVLPDTPENRRKMRSKLGYVVALLENGTIEVLAKDPTNRLKRKHRYAERTGRAVSVTQRVTVSDAQKAQWRAEDRERANDRDAYVEKRDREKFFKEQQGKACPKRQGKANSHDDIGKYVKAFATHDPYAYRTEYVNQAKEVRMKSQRPRI